MIVILSGVSGAGKDTIKKMLMKENENIVTLPSYTTRKMRDGEEQGKPYYFVTKEEFKQMIEDGSFYEYSVHHDNYYGTSKKLLNEKIKEGKVTIKDIDVNGTESLTKLFENTNTKIISIFLNITKEEMLNRLMERGDMYSEEVLSLRMSRYDYEVSRLNMYTYVVRNVDAEKTKKIILDIIKREQE